MSAGVRVLGEDYPDAVRSAEPEIRTLYLPTVVCERLGEMLVDIFNFERRPEVTNWDRNYDPRPTEKYSYLANLFRQLIGADGGWARLELSWIQTMDLQFVLRECAALPRQNPDDPVPEYEDFHLKATDMTLRRFARQFNEKC